MKENVKGYKGIQKGEPMINVGIPASDRYPISSGAASEEHSAFDRNSITRSREGVKGMSLKSQVACFIAGVRMVP
jgi:hypothetical protein